MTEAVHPWVYGLFAAAYPGKTVAISLKRGYSENSKTERDGRNHGRKQERKPDAGMQSERISGI